MTLYYITPISEAFYGQSNYIIFDIGSSYNVFPLNGLNYEIYPSKVGNISIFCETDVSEGHPRESRRGSGKGQKF
jgi:hypothetical protein